MAPNRTNTPCSQYHSARAEGVPFLRPLQARRTAATFGWAGLPAPDSSGRHSLLVLLLHPGGPCFTAPHPRAGRCRVYRSIMPLPLQACADDIPTDVCCTSLFDVADRIRCIANTAVVAAFHESCADREWRSYVTVGQRAAEPLGDALVVYMPALGQSPDSRSPSGKLNSIVLERARFVIFLTENGWPTIVADEMGDVISVPDSNVLHALARHSYGHAEAMYRAIRRAAAKNATSADALFPIATFRNLVQSFEVGDLTPVDPAAFTVGWTLPITATVLLQ
jgi:hypothetical protein